MYVFVVPQLLAQSGGAVGEVKHYGYSGTDKLMECIHQVYGKPVARLPYIRRLPDLPCPGTREGIKQLLQSVELSRLLGIPDGEVRGVRLYEMSDWIYLHPILFLEPSTRGPYYAMREEWTSVKIHTDVEVEQDGDISESEAKLLAPTILEQARMISLRPMNDPINNGVVDLDVRLRFYQLKLAPDAPESVITVIDQPSLFDVGRIVYGEMRGGQYQMLWDSPLFNSRGGVHFEEVNGDGWKEIVWESATCGAQECSPQQLVVFDKDGREITRQPHCNTKDFAFDESDGVCAIEGESVQLAVISAPAQDSSEKKGRAVKDIVVTGGYAKGKDAIFTLEKGMYIRNKLDLKRFSAKVATERKAKEIAAAIVSNQEGMRLMKEGRYQEAVYKFQSACFDNDTALYANNYGFALYMAGQYESAVYLLQKAIRLDPKRSVAYLNLGDAYAKLNRPNLKSIELQQTRNHTRKFGVIIHDQNCFLRGVHNVQNFII